jgi:hypothetical protein
VPGGSGYDNVVPSIVRFGPFEANLATGELRKRAVAGDSAAAIDVSMLSSVGALVSREQLRERLWPGGLRRRQHGVNKAINKPVARSMMRRPAAFHRDAPAARLSIHRAGHVGAG